MSLQFIRLAGTKRFWFDSGRDRFAFGLNPFPGRWGLALLIIVDERFCLTKADR